MSILIIYDFFRNACESVLTNSLRYVKILADFAASNANFRRLDL